MSRTLIAAGKAIAIAGMFMLFSSGNVYATHGGLISTNTATVDSAIMGLVLDPVNNPVDAMILQGFTQNIVGKTNGSGVTPFPGDATKNYVPSGNPGAFTNNPDKCIAMVEHRNAVNPSIVDSVTLLVDIGDFRTYIGAGVGATTYTANDVVKWCFDPVITFGAAGFDPQTAPNYSGVNQATGLIDSHIPVNIQSSNATGEGAMSIIGEINFTIDVNPDAGDNGVATLYQRIEQSMDLTTRNNDTGDVIAGTDGTDRVILEQGWVDNPLTNTAIPLNTSPAGPDGIVGTADDVVQNAFTTNNHQRLSPEDGSARNIPWSVSIDQDTPWAAVAPGTLQTSIRSSGIYEYNDPLGTGTYNTSNGLQGAKSATGSFYPAEGIFDLPGYANKKGANNFPSATANSDPLNLN